ncbi:MAG: sodium-translocating pyrophosphatase [Nitrospinae bacterium]|nr:sodium-translocating pyrophosphatase [Nitrospinota bacterium]MBF0634848.1 sodium-translocating pyrophosphatase [Nitrospinota bacterium]
MKATAEVTTQTFTAGQVILFAEVAGVISVLYAVFLILRIMRLPEGTEKMISISGAIREGAMAYLNRQSKVIAVFAVLIFGLLFTKIGAAQGLGFLAGALLSAAAGYIGMMVAVRANVRTAEAARHGLENALDVAFKGGSVTGLMVVGLSLMGVTATYALTNDPMTTVGFGFGASLISLFARVGGGIFTKAADVGADLVGKLEAGIPEDDPRNPAVIADNVGDNVGDCAGMGADLFETYAVTLIAAMILASTSASIKAAYGVNAVLFPLALGGAAIFATIIGTFFIRLGLDKSITMALYKGQIATGVISAAAFYYINDAMMGGNFNLFLCAIIGLLVTLLVTISTEYYTSTKFHPVKAVSKACETGAATNIIIGVAMGLESTTPVILIIVASIASTYALAGVFGIAVAAVAMLSTTGMVIAMDSYGPITDNAGGIAEMSGLPKEVRAITDELDAVGNTTKAVTKGYAIGSAALAALVLFQAYSDEIAHVAQKHVAFELTDVSLIIGLFIGAALPYFFSAHCMEAVGRAAFAVVTEVRYQFQEIKGIMSGEATPDYAECVDIVTQAALKEMIVPALAAVLSPIFVGYVFGPVALAGLLAGVIVSGLLMALFMCNGGATWDNAKKHIEMGHHGGKGSDAHKAAVVGDTVGDPFKDTAGPALNALIKVINTIALLIAPSIATIKLLS